MELLLLGIGGALGAVCRYVVGRSVPHDRFPWSTLIVNATGSLLLGIVLFSVGNADIALLIGGGFCGAFTTFSTFSFQTVGLWERDELTLAIGNALANLIVSLVGFSLGWILSHSL